MLIKPFVPRLITVDVSSVGSIKLFIYVIRPAVVERSWGDEI